MPDIEALTRLKGQVADAYQTDDVVGLNALCVLDGWHFADDGRTLVAPSGAVPDTDRGLPRPMDNPAVSVDAAMALAERHSPKEWPDVLHRSVRILSDRHAWHICFARPGQREQLARAILLALVERLVQDAGGADIGG